MEEALLSLPPPALPKSKTGQALGVPISIREWFLDFVLLLPSIVQCAWGLNVHWAYSLPLPSPCTQARNWACLSVLFSNPVFP